MILKEYSKKGTRNISKLFLLGATFLAPWLSTPVYAATAQVLDRYTTQRNRVTVKVDVRDASNVPIEGLQKRNFSVLTSGQDGEIIDPAEINFQVATPEQSNPDPAYIAILLDMSGSMRQSDAEGNPKLQGALAAIKALIAQTQQYDIPAQIAIVPFGYGGGNTCNSLFEVSADTIADKSPFLTANDETLASTLDDLSETSVCASTNLVEPLEVTADYLRKQFNDNISVLELEEEAEAAALPRLVMILLSDGYDENPDKRYKVLQNSLTQSSPPITLHTLGYGETLRELRNRAKCSTFIPEANLSPETVNQACELPQQDIREFLIDEQQLEDLATATGGIFQISSNASGVAESLTNFLRTLRQYELTYIQPGADRATQHLTSVQINDDSRQIDLTTAKKRITMKNWGYRTLAFTDRIAIFGVTSLLVLAGILPFRWWSQRLKSQAERNLY